MARKIGYWTGAVGIVAAAALVVLVSWRAGGPADPESVTDRVRVLVGAAALAALPWVGRGRGLFGPVADNGVARLVRIGGCAGICAMGLGIVRADRHAGINGVVGSGQFSWLRETAGLVILIGAFAAPLVLKARRPLIQPEACWMTAMVVGVIAFVLVPMQAFAVGFAALVFAATSRRSPVVAASWTDRAYCQPANRQRRLCAAVRVRQSLQRHGHRGFGRNSGRRLRGGGGGAACARGREPG